MFWLKQKRYEKFISRNQRYAISFGKIHNVHADILGNIKFEEYIMDKRIEKIIEDTFIDTKNAVDELGSKQVLENLAYQLSELLLSKSEIHDISQIAWAMNVARDIIFAYAPAIASHNNLDAHDITSKFFATLIYNISKPEKNSQTVNMVNVLNSVKVVANEKH